MLGRRLLDINALVEASTKVASAYVRLRRARTQENKNTPSIRKSVQQIQVRPVEASKDTSSSATCVPPTNLPALQSAQPNRHQILNTNQSCSLYFSEDRATESSELCTNNEATRVHLNPTDELADPLAEATKYRNKNNQCDAIDTTTDLWAEITGIRPNKAQYRGRTDSVECLQPDVIPYQELKRTSQKDANIFSSPQEETSDEMFPQLFRSLTVSDNLRSSLSRGSPRKESSSRLRTNCACSEAFGAKIEDKDSKGALSCTSSIAPKRIENIDQSSVSAAIGNTEATNLSFGTSGQGSNITIASDKQGFSDLRRSYKPIECVASTSTMQESTVPSSQLGRLWQYGGLATSMALGAITESIRKAAGTSTDKDGSNFLNERNAGKIVKRLSRMRGAALKLGQVISFQDSKMLPPQVSYILQRVQDSADYMPAWQRNKVLEQNLGPDWSRLFSSFEETPMAAASIGQVHGAVLADSKMPVAVKIQYPGVSASISSDLSNLSAMLVASNMLPRGLYLEKTIANARKELTLECDYMREAESAELFKELLADDDVFVVPSIMRNASGPKVLTMERMQGIAVTRTRLTRGEKDWIGSQILRLCLREIFEFHYMQTDPNWTNFLFNNQTNKLELLDFGACQKYSLGFMKNYARILHAASKGDKTGCIALSIDLGYLTGRDSKAMEEAHVASLLTLAEPFREDAPEIYDFSGQTITDRIRSLLPVMLRERLSPPPEETYSLHRKLSGAFLLCARLGSRIPCRDMFASAMARSQLL